MESHLMKNSEWGAVAYLAHSQYGTNGIEIELNNNRYSYTGYSGGSTDANESSNRINTYAYNTTNGVKSSSTRNIYGIYDLSGGATEYVAAYNSKEDSTNQYVTNNGWTNLKSTTASTEYATKYSNNSNPETREAVDIYNVGKTGDATKEVYTHKYVEYKYRNWKQDYSFFVYSVGPFFVRSGGRQGSPSVGIFFVNGFSGGADSLSSFRVVLAP